MREFVFTWTLQPAGIVMDEFSFDSGGPLIVSIKRDRLEIRAYAAENEKDRLRQEAAALASNLAHTLGMHYHAAITLGPPMLKTFHAEPCSNRMDVAVTITGGQISMSGDLSFELRDAAGNVIDSSEMRREEERRRKRRRTIHLATRACEDPVLREMLEYRAQYEADPLGRLHHLYDILQVAERVYRGREGAADRLKLSLGDLRGLARIANDPNLTNARHPGESPEHHPASVEEIETCERVADAIVDVQADL